MTVYDKNNDCNECLEILNMNYYEALLNYTINQNPNQLINKKRNLQKWKHFKRFNLKLEQNINWNK